MNVEDLITEMKEVKALHNILSITEVLTIFQIKAIQNLADEIRRARNG